jgi:hypothetical protein
MYMMKSLTNMILLKRQLYSLCMKEGTKIVDHLNTFNTLLVQLTSMGVKFDYEDKQLHYCVLCPRHGITLLPLLVLAQQKVLSLMLLLEH